MQRVRLLLAVTSEAEQSLVGYRSCDPPFREALARANRAFAESGCEVAVEAVDRFDLGSWDERDPGALLDACVDSRAELHAARTRASASLVVVVAGRHLRARGHAFTMSRPDPRFAPYAYAVVNVQALHGHSMTLAHELGHLFGADHDRDHIEGEPPAGPAYGWRFTAGGVGYRTIMGRGPATLLPVFSSPDLTHDGVPCGNAEANNAAVIRSNAAIVAAFATAP